MESFTVSDIKKIFRIEADKKTIMNAEQDGRIPTATRIPRGKIQARAWKTEDLPMIGREFSQFKSPDQTKYISVFTSKGGVLKSSVSYNLARTLALSGIKTLIIGLDIQESITTLALGNEEETSLDDYEARKGLADYIIDGATFDEIVYETDLPTLSIIPETHRLNNLSYHIFSETKREEVFKRKLLKSTSKYDVVLFDCSPFWSNLIENALTMSSTIISPVSLKVGSFQSLPQNLAFINDFLEKMNLSPDFILCPTLSERTKISKEVLGAITSQFNDNVTATDIRKSVTGEEALSIGKSIFEYAPTSPLADDYYDLLSEIWPRILEGVH
jgi:chromosome partitioning protein